jgi:hypothetical protein
MALKAEGIWPCTVLGGNYGEDPDPKRAGVMIVQINVQIDEGPSKGQRCTYQDDVTARSSIYIMRSCEAVGWKGGPQGDDLSTLKTDIAAWVEKTGGKSTVEIKHIPIKNGKRAGETWDKVNSIGRGPKVLKAAAGDAAADAREAMRRARQDVGGAPPEDDAPPVSDDEIPFISCAFREPSLIAKVLR